MTARSFRSVFSIANSTILLMGVLLVVASSNINWGKEHWRVILQTDAEGYYAYLPALFVFHDANFGFFDAIEYGERQNHLFFDYRTKYKDVYIAKFYSGTALAELPFFLIAHGIAHATGEETDGYSKPYPVAVNLAAIFYVLLGLFMLRQLMSSYKIREWPQALTLVATLFGTNLFYYAVVEPGMSHAYSFAFVCLFLFVGRRWMLEARSRDVLLLGLLLGMIVLIRPVNGLIGLALPFLAGSWAVLSERIIGALKKPLALVGGLAGFVAVLFIQLCWYKAATGDFLVYAYAHETFHFDAPHLIDFLFSYKKGLFVYTPLYFVALAGVVALWKRSRFEAITLVSALLAIIYVLASWWLWWYGGSFSSRVMVEYLPLFMLLLAFALDRFPTVWFRRSLPVLVVLLIVLCQIQTYQYRYYQIHWEDMTKEKYWDVFLRLDKL